MEKNIEKALEDEVKWVMDMLINSPFDTADRNYYQGRLDQLAMVRGLLNHKQILISKS